MVQGDNDLAVAYALFTDIAAAEGKNTSTYSGANRADKKWILDTFTECLIAVRGPTARHKTP